MFESELEKAKLETEVIELRKANLTLQSKLIKAKAKVDDLVAATIESAHDAVINLGGIGDVTPPKPDKRKAREVVCLWHLTDWQGGKQTPSYDSAVMVDRVNEFMVKAHKLILDYRKARPVKHCVILLGGDMVEGLFNYPTQPYEIDSSLFEMYINVSKLLVETVQKALGIFEKVTVIAEWGNHGRIGSRRDAVVRSDNVDRMCYELARQLLKDEKRLIWEDCPNDWQPVIVGNYRAVLIHGDEVGRNGFSGTATILQHVQRWQAGALPFTFSDCYIGHYHNYATWSLGSGLGHVYQTGSTESENRYASVHLAATSIPSQRMHIIDPDKGRVIAEHKIYLDGK